MKNVVSVEGEKLWKAVWGQEGEMHRVLRTGDGLSHPVSDAESGWRIHGPCFMEPEALLWLHSNRPWQDFLTFLLCMFHGSPVCDSGPWISFDFLELISSCLSILFHWSLWVPWCLLMLTLAQWSVGRRIWKNESLEWQFCYKLIFIDLGLIQDPVKHGKTQPLPWAKLGPKGLESWQVSQVPCLYHLCLAICQLSRITLGPWYSYIFIAPEERMVFPGFLKVFAKWIAVYFICTEIYHPDFISDLIHL